VEKGKDKKGETSIVFLVSNFPDSSKEYIRIYKLRWGIEMFHRTAKQSLGLKNCQSTNRDMQKVRICNVFYIYAFLHHQKKLRKVSSVEFVIRSLQMLKPEELMVALVAFNQIFHENN
nr:transposase [Candidatus Dependentiae bacterium]